MTTSTIVTTTSATTSNNVKGNNMNTYFDTVSRLKIETLVKLAHSSEFRSEFKPLVKAKDQNNYLSAVYERLDVLIEQNLLPTEYAMIPGMDKDLKMVEKELEKSFKGMVKLPLSDSQKETRKLQTFVEKFIAFGNLAERMMALYPKVTGESEFGGHWFQLKKFAQEHTGTTSINKELIKSALKCASDMGIKDVMVAKGKVLASVSEFIRVNRINTSYIKGITSMPVYNGLKGNVNVNTKKPVIALDYIAIGRWVSQATYNLNATTLSSDYLTALGRIIVVTESGRLLRYNVKPFIGAKGTDLRKVCEHISLNTVLSLINVVGVEMSSLLADARNFIVVNFMSYTYEDKAGIERTVKKYIVSENPYENQVIYTTNTQHSFWGISSPDTLKKGIIRATYNSTGFAEVVNGGYKTMAGGANKMVARTVKLDKSGDTLVIPKVAVVVDTCGSERITAALSTGAVHVPSSIFRKEGQCRIVSDATQGGMKGTFGVVGFLDPILEEQGISLTSFGSLKSNLFGINSILGVSAKDVSELPVKSLKIGKDKVKVVFLPKLEVIITNNYLINNFIPVNRDALVKNWDEANEVLSTRIAEKATTIREDNIFVEYVKDLRDSDYNGDLIECLKDLLKQGEIKAKTQQVSITSSEYDVMSYTMGRDKAVEWQNNMLTNEHNKDDSEKDLMFKRAFQHNAGTEFNSPCKYISAVDMYRAYINICEDNGISLKSPVGSFASRNLLVDLYNTLFDDEGKYEYLFVDNGESSIYLPVGSYMSGNFHKTSSVFDDKVSVTGFLPKVLKHIAYGADALACGVYSDKLFEKFCSNVTTELTVDLIGKKLGKLKATGFYGVMQPAWWSNSVDKVFSPGFKTISGKECLIAKHPELLEDSLTGATAVSSFPKALTKGMSQDVLDVVEFALQTTIFVHEDMLLGVMNDCDGDLVRATFHKGIKFPHFEARALKSTYFAHKWHQAYKADEQSFATVKPVVEKFHTMSATMDAINDAAYAKACVALFTSNAQRLAQRVYMDAKSMDGTYEYAQRIMNTWVQVFAMNAIKQQAGSSKGALDLMLPEYFLIWDLHVEIRGKGAELFEDFLVNTMGIDMADHGYKDNRDFIEQFTVLLESIQDISSGSVMVGKDVSIAEASKDFQLDLSSLNGKILQDRLVLAYAKKLGLL